MSHTAKIIASAIATTVLSLGAVAAVTTAPVQEAVVSTHLGCC